MLKTFFKVYGIICIVCGALTAIFTSASILIRFIWLFSGIFFGLIYISFSVILELTEDMRHDLNTIKKDLKDVKGSIDELLKNSKADVAVNASQASVNKQNAEALKPKAPDVRTQPDSRYYDENVVNN